MKFNVSKGLSQKLKTALYLSTASLILAPAAYAQCSPGFTGTSGNDTITCTGNQSTGVNALGLAGDDTIIADNANLNGANFDIIGNAGNDTIIVTDSIINDIRGDNVAGSGIGGDDTITITNTVVIEQIEFDEGNDTLTATDSDIFQILSNGGDETITLVNSNVSSTINISAGADTVILDNSTLQGALIVGSNSDMDGADNVTIRNGSSVDGIIGLGNGDDTILVVNSVLDERIEGGDGNDQITMQNSDNTGNNVDIEGEAGDDVIVISNSVLNDVRGDDVSAGSADGDDRITITNSTVEEQIWAAGGDDIVTLDGVSLLNGGGTSGASLSLGTGSDVVNLTGGEINGFIDLGDDEDTIVLNGSTVFNTTSQNSLVAGDGSDNVTINGGVYEGISMNTSVNDFSIVDELVINGGTFNGSVRLSGGNDLVTINGGNLNNGIGIVGQGFQQETIVINGGVVGENPADGHSVFTGEDEDQVGIFGGDVQSYVSLGSGDDLLVIDGGADEYNSAISQTFIANGFIANVNNPHDPATNDLNHGITGGTLIATPTEFRGGSGDDVAEIFDLVQTENLDFESWNDVNIYGLSITLADDAAGEASQSIDFLRLLRGSTLTQTSGRLDIVAEGGAVGGVSTLIVDGSSRVILQDGVVDDLIAVQTFAPDAGSFLAVDVDTVSEGLVSDSSDYIIGGTHTPTAGAIVNVNIVNSLGATSQTGSRRIVDSNAAAVEAPNLGDRANPSATYVLQNDPSFGARQFWLEDDGNGGVYLVWTIPVSPVTMSAILGGAASGAALNDDGTLNLRDPNLSVDQNGKGAGLTGLFAGNSAGFVAGTVNGMDGGGANGLQCDNGKFGLNAWGNIGFMTGEYGNSDVDTGHAALGIEKDLSSLNDTECGRFKLGAFVFTSQSDITQTLLTSSNDVGSYGIGAYLRAATESNFYGSILGYLGKTDNSGNNAIMESRYDFESDDWGARLDVGKLLPLNEHGMNVDIRGHIGISNSSADPFMDTNGFEITSIDSETLSYGATLGLNKAFDHGQLVYGRAGVEISDIETNLLAYTIPIESNPSYTLGTVEAGYENTTENGNGTLRLSGLAKFGEDVSSYGIQLTGIVRF